MKIFPKTQTVKVSKRFKKGLKKLSYTEKDFVENTEKQICLIKNNENIKQSSFSLVFQKIKVDIPDDLPSISYKITKKSWKRLINKPITKVKEQFLNINNLFGTVDEKIFLAQKAQNLHKKINNL